MFEELIELGFKGIWAKIWPFVTIAGILGIIAFAIWVNVKIETMKKVAYDSGYLAAHSVCEAEKAASIIKGKISKERIENEIRKMPDADLLRFMSANGWLRAQ